MGTIARTPMVTRTMTTTKAEVMCCDIPAGEVFTQEVIIPREYNTLAELLTAVKPIIETPEIKAVEVLSFETSVDLYGMTEQEFIETAKILPTKEENN